MGVKLFYANAYPMPNYVGGAEANLAKKGQWSPSSKDFEQTAQLSGGGTGVGTLDDIIKEIGKEKVGSIDELGIIAHANASYFCLSGTVLTSGPSLPDVTFTQPGMVDAAGLTGKKTQIDAIKDRFAKGAQIVLYGCHAGLDDSLIKAMSTAFGVTVYGFSNQVEYLLLWSTPSNMVTSRGKTFIDSTGAIAAGLATPSSLAQPDIKSLSPDKQSSTAASAYRTKTSSSSSSGGGSTP